MSRSRFSPNSWRSKVARKILQSKSRHFWRSSMHKIVASGDLESYIDYDPFCGDFWFWS